MKDKTDIIFGIHSEPLECGCNSFDCKVFRKNSNTEVVNCIEINITKEIALTQGDEPRIVKDDNGLDKIHTYWTEGVELRCLHGKVSEV